MQCSNYVYVSPRVFTVIWTGVFALRAFCVTYFVTVTRFYWVTQGSILASRFNFYRIGLAPRHYPLLTIMHGVFAAYHALQLCRMLTAAARDRGLGYGCGPFCVWQAIVHPLCAIASAARASFRRPQIEHKASEPSRVQRLALHVFAAFSAVFGREGLLGVEGKHYDTVLIVREVVETTLQSSQAYAVSRHVPRPWLNRLYVALIVVNCLMTPLLHTVFTSNKLVRRAVLLACDATLDLFSSVILPSLLIVMYLRDYNPSSGFETALWLNDHWFLNAKNELQLLVVSSWLDFTSRIVFALAFIGCLEHATSLLRVAPPSPLKRVHPSVRPHADAVRGATTPRKRDHPSQSPFSSTVSSTVCSSVSSSVGDSRQPVWCRRLRHLAHFAFGGWAIIVLAMHLHAEHVPRLEQCAIEVRPWLVVKPACVMVLLDCSQHAMVGYQSDVASQWETLDAVYVIRLVVRHCPRLQLPPALQRFRSLDALKIYNSTIDDWSSEAALTDFHHPVLRTLILVRVHLPNGQLPEGIMDPAFPKALLNIQVCTSNLNSLPADLDTKWPLHGSYLFESSLFTSVPAVVQRLQPRQLSVAFNHLTAFPFEVLAWPSLRILNVGGNPIASLMDDRPGTTVSTATTTTSALVILVLADTNITVLPRWIDHVLLARTTILPYYGVRADRTPLCQLADRIQRGELTSFPDIETVPSAALSFAMATTTLPHATLLTALSVCTPYTTLFYPLAFEDVANGMYMP